MQAFSGTDTAEVVELLRLGEAPELENEVWLNSPAARLLTFWSAVAPKGYRFYANVYPEVDHPRWSQATEQRVGESERRPRLSLAVMVTR